MTGWVVSATILWPAGCATVSVHEVSRQNNVLRSEECDPDWDGAFLGAAIGISPLVYSVFTAGEGDGVPLGFKLGFVGGIAGFWAGLAIDSRNCRDPT